MAKRQITKNQQRRIQQNINDINQLDLDLIKGLVINRYNRNILVEINPDHYLSCSLKPNLDQVVAGDFVLVQQTNTEQGVIVHCLPRKTLLGRPDKHGKFKTIAANISQILIVVAPLPEPIFSLLDSYLVAAELLQLNAAIILNKTDLPHQPLLQTLQTIYQPLGYAIYLNNCNTSPKSNQSPLKTLLDNQSSIFVGQSGVGKSSIIQKILPQEQLAIDPFPEITCQGRHTTVQSRLYHLSNRTTSNSNLIDSPGIREFGLWQMSRNNIALGFREFHPFINQCKYRNCTHNYQQPNQTPGCALINAVEKNQINPQRLKNYVKLCETYT